MKNKYSKIILLGYLLSFNASLAIAQDFTVNSYFPSPYGEYKDIQLVPQNPDLSNPCTIGQLYTNSTNILNFCKDSSGTGQWSELINQWTINTNDIFPKNTISNVNLFIGIGTSTPDTRLTVQSAGNTNATTALHVTNSTGDSLLLVRDDGFVGVGTSNPLSHLHIMDNKPGDTVDLKIRNSSSQSVAQITFREQDMADAIILRYRSYHPSTEVNWFEIWGSPYSGYTDALNPQRPIMQMSRDYSLSNSPQSYGGIGISVPQEEIVQAKLEVRSRGYADIAHFYNSNKERVFNLDVNGNLGILTTAVAPYVLDINGAIQANSFTPSDIRLKTNIKPVQNSLEKTLKLNPISFEWIDKKMGENRYYGFIAQEVEDIFPEVVITDANGIKAIEYDKLTVPLIESIKELKEKQEEIELRIKKLEDLQK